MSDAHPVLLGHSEYELADDTRIGTKDFQYDSWDYLTTINTHS